MKSFTVRISGHPAEYYEIIRNSDLQGEEETKMKKIYFTVTGTNHRYGHEFAEPKMKVRLEKEPDNEYDTEAIMVKIDGLGQIGYVANSPYTVVGQSYSAGRLYDKIGDTAEGTILYKLPNESKLFSEN